ncbi:hypothetical protein GF380_01565 [Candidatus Uhrbacteria bacterium]|nr:hypothetical protein [Candidatus Uhrbacteria bacterium]MBD3283955.1 hypothetical protein [Candidatus Uhrbacteria bacterium]
MKEQFPTTEQPVEKAPADEQKKPSQEGGLVGDEQKRRERIAGLQRSATLFDEQFVRTQTHGSPERRLQTQKTIESLSHGSLLESGAIGDEDKASQNVVRRNTYEGDPPRIAYVKPQSGESWFDYDAQNDTARVIRLRRGEAGTLEEEEVDLGIADERQKTILQRALSRKVKEAHAVAEDIARYYDIEPSEAPNSGDKVGKLFGLEAGDAPVREFAVSRIDMMVGFDTVPVTVLREEPDHSDISSVQEAVKSANPEKPARPMNLKDLQSLIDQGPEHPGAQSFMRIASLDYLVKSLDRHTNNVLYDEEAQQFHAIDNGGSLGLNRRTEDGASKPADNYHSVPMEVLSRHPEWQLDEEAMTQLTELKDAVYAYLQKREIQSTGSDEGQEMKQITNLFRILYPNPKIAKVEGAQFLARIDRLIKDGRPPVDELISANQLQTKTVDKAVKAQQAA